MMMMVMALGSAHCLSQILDIGKLARGRGVREIGSQLVELSRGRRIALRLGSLGGALQVGGDLLGNLLILGRIRLLELLERAHQLGER